MPPSPAAPAETLRVRLYPLSTLRGWPGNPKQHDLTHIRTSITRYGFNDPVAIAADYERLVEGHGRTEVLEGLRADGERPPRNILLPTELSAAAASEIEGRHGPIPEGDWIVPCIELDFESEVEAEGYLLAHNQSGATRGWDPDLLAPFLERQREAVLAEGGNAAKHMRDIGFTRAVMGKLRQGIGAGNSAEPPAPDLDAAEELQKKWGTALGQRWKIGRHFLYCGDSTSPTDVAALLQGARPRLMVTDPPYGVAYDPSWRDEAAAEGHIQFAARRKGKVKNDDRADWTEAWRLSPADVAYVWHAGIHTATVQTNLEDVGFVTRSQIIWVKDRMAISRGSYHWQHEPCIYAVRKGKKASWLGDRSQTTVWNIAVMAVGDSDTKIHGTQKPLECMERPIRHHEGDVYDPFCGSGTTIAAAERQERVAYCLELDPNYVAVILERFSLWGLETTLED